ncbi:FAD-dependent monooxygenase [Candidatus Profftia tarda]|nr:FAD-dependent monooxygenase [Candidatus Profftia tarda]
MQSFDIIISGGGMLGLAIVAALRESGLRIALIEHKIPNLEKLTPKSALRVSAINTATEHMLKYLGIWQDILDLRASSYQSMEIWDKDSFGNISFHAQEYGYTHLGYIIENSVIQQTLWDKVSCQSGVTIIAPAVFQEITWGEKEAFIILNNRQILTTRLVIGIDGAHSWLRAHTDIPITFWDYRHHALVATIQTEQPHNNCARQVFSSNGILAFLPLKDKQLCSIVWSTNPEKIKYLLSLPESDFNRELAVTFDMRLGLCKIVSSRQSYRLIGQYARSFAAHRLALAGDAAHTIHPLAGQGLNLGFMDIAKLSFLIKHLHHQGKDIGRYTYLRSYERSCKNNAALMLTTMQGLQELFEGKNIAKKLLRDIGMTIVNNVPLLKTRLVRYGMDLSYFLDLLE